MPHPDQRLVTTAFTATIFASAFLLFSVQPMFAKMVLPVLRGAPAVWAVSLCFFQVLLLLGYAYAHLLERLLKPRIALIVHLAVQALALVALPISLPVGWAATAPEGAYLWLIGILAVGVGLPFFAVSANAPLLQAWFARSTPGGSTDAYSLYAASNAGSLGALLAYPFLIEPLLPLSLQSRVWAVGFVLLGGMIGWCGYLMLQAPAERPGDLGTGASASGAGTWRERATWAALTFVPSGLLVAFTTFVTTDIAAVPLLWVVPLAIFLATFVVAFRPRLPVSRNLLLIVQLLAVPVALATMDWDATFAWALSCLAGTIAFIATCLICHRQLYERRPGPERLTDFYLWMSAGGALGGIFSALIAPQIFTDLLEYPLLLGLGMLCRLGWREAAAPENDRRLLAGAAAGIAVLALAATSATAFGWIAWTPPLRLYTLAVLGAAVIALWRWPALELTAAVALIAGVALLPNGNRPVHVARSFFGTHKVVEPPGGAFRMLLHGTTLHGAQRINDPRLAAGAPPMPLAYYHPAGPLARGLLLARVAAGDPSRPLRVGIVGLGAGAMACNALRGDRWRFFEIDPEVIRIASNPAYFTYLSSCQPDAAMVLGDARLTLAREPRGSFDYLLLDAFASDAVPIHLLTVEAIRLYGELLSARGVLVLHVSTRTSICHRSSRPTSAPLPASPASSPRARPAAAPSARR